MSKRQEFHGKVKLAAWERAKGHCEICGNKITRGVQYDHATPDAVGGEPTLANCQVLCAPCHSIKTALRDIPDIAKTVRVLKKLAGVKPPSKRPPMMGSKKSGWKKKIDGTVVRR